MGEVAEQVENTNGESKGDQRTDTTDATLDGVIHEKIINQIEVSSLLWLKITVIQC